MTTIAYRDGVLAADSQMTIGTMILGTLPSTKIGRRRNGDLGAAAGSAGYNAAFLRWFLQEYHSGGEEPPEPKEGSDYMDRGIIFRAEGNIEVHERGGAFIIEAPYYAIGNGREIAVGVMWMGGTAVQALEAAIAHDTYTCGPIIVLRHDGT